MLSIPEQPENISVRVFVLVLASNRCEGTVVRRVQFRKHWATVVALTFLAKSPAGIVSRAEHSENVLLKAVAPVSPSKIPGGHALQRRGPCEEAVAFGRGRALPEEEADRFEGRAVLQGVGIGRHFRVAGEQSVGQRRQCGAVLEHLAEGRDGGIAAEQTGGSRFQSRRREYAGGGRQIRHPGENILRNAFEQRAVFEQAADVGDRGCAGESLRGNGFQVVAVLEHRGDILAGGAAGDDVGADLFKPRTASEQARERGDFGKSAEDAFGDAFERGAAFEDIGERGDRRIGGEQPCGERRERRAAVEGVVEGGDQGKAVEQPCGHFGQRGAVLEDVVEGGLRHGREGSAAFEQLGRDALQFAASGETAHKGRHLVAACEQVGRERSGWPFC